MVQYPIYMSDLCLSQFKQVMYRLMVFNLLQDPILLLLVRCKQGNPRLAPETPEYKALFGITVYYGLFLTMHALLTMTVRVGLVFALCNLTQIPAISYKTLMLLLSLLHY